MGIIDHSTQLLPISVTWHGAVGTKNEVGCSILKHLVDSLLGLIYTAFSARPRRK